MKMVHTFLESLMSTPSLQENLTLPAEGFYEACRNRKGALHRAGQEALAPAFRSPLTVRRLEKESSQLFKKETLIPAGTGEGKQNLSHGQAFRQETNHLK